MPDGELPSKPGPGSWAGRAPEHSVVLPTGDARRGKQGEQTARSIDAEREKLKVRPRQGKMEGEALGVEEHRHCG